MDATSSLVTGSTAFDVPTAADSPAAPGPASADDVDVDALMGSILSRLLVREGLSGAAGGPPAASVDDGRFLQLQRIERYLRHQYAVFGEQVTVRRAGMRGRAERFIKRVIRKVLRWYARPQVEFNASSSQAVRECLKHLSVLAAELAAVRGEIRNQSSRARAGALASEPCAVEYYYRFEERFRGPSELIRERQRPYVDEFAGLNPVVDLGCGRGEFLELLRRAGNTAYGVDENPDMIAFCQARGLPVVAQDLFGHLESVPDRSLGGINLSQVVEHLPPPQIHRLLGLARDRLTWDGVLIAETPNPICEAAMRNFYLDPTHVRPVHPELLRFLAEDAGLCFSHFFFTSPLPERGPANLRVRERLEEHDVSYYRDFAAVLRRT